MTVADIQMAGIVRLDRRVRHHTGHAATPPKVTEGSYAGGIADGVEEQAGVSKNRLRDTHSNYHPWVAAGALGNLFQVLTEREERSAVAMASNEAFSGSTKTFTDPNLKADTAHVRRSTQLAAVVLGGVSLLSACTGGSTGTATNHTATTSVVASSTAATVGPSHQSTPAFHPAGIQITEVAEVAHLQKFITTYNTGRLRMALAQFSHTQPLGFSDCDYQTQQVITGHGRAQLVAWLHANIAHHDHLTVAGIVGATPDQPVLGVSFRRRNSDTITHAHPDGITPTLGAKVKFDATGLITQFNNGPYGGSPNACHIR